MALIWTHDDLNPVLDAMELTHDQSRWEAEHCAHCGNGLDDSRLFRCNAWYHEACLEQMETLGGINE